MSSLFERKIYRSDMFKCALCYEAPCSKACADLDPARLLRSIWFDDEKVAACNMPEKSPCIHCAAPCEQACVLSEKVPIRKLMLKLGNEVRPELEIALLTDENRLKSDICGIEIENPFLLSSSVVASSYDMCKRAFEAGWAGVAFKTICNFDIREASPRFSAIKGDSGTIIGFKNIEQLSDHSLEENMETFRRLKAEFPEKFILASIMGQNEDEWEYLTRLCAENGADAVELNFSCPNMMEEGLGSDIGQCPDLVEKYTRAAKRGADIPVIAKLTPNVANMNPAAEAAIRGGADGLAAINTIKSITDVNIHTYISAPAVRMQSAVGGYSGRAVKPIALRFVTELAQNPLVDGKHISGMGGIETWRDALEFILLGAGSVQVTTAVMQYGYRIIDDLKAGLNYYLAEKGIANVRDMRGLALESVSQTTDVLERDTVVFPKFNSEKCVGCGRCVIACADGGHQALNLNDDRKIMFNGNRCVGCHLCLLVCPQRAITSSHKRIHKR